MGLPAKGKTLCCACMFSLRLLKIFPFVFGLAAAPLFADTDYNFTVRVTDVDGDFSEKAFTLRVISAPPLENFGDWASTNISNSSLRGFYDDADGDGIINLIEYAFDLSPNSPDGLNSQPTVQLGADRISITFLRDEAKSDIIYMVEGTDDLTEWNEVLYNSSNPGPGYETNNNGTRMTVEDTQTLGPATPQRYLRVKILPPQ